VKGHEIDGPVHGSLDRFLGGPWVGIGELSRYRDEPMRAIWVWRNRTLIHTAGSWHGNLIPCALMANCAASERLHRRGCYRYSPLTGARPAPLRSPRRNGCPRSSERWQRSSGYERAATPPISPRSRFFARDVRTCRRAERGPLIKMTSVAYLPITGRVTGRSGRRVARLAAGEPLE
jgi:hypothetical protein